MNYFIYSEKIISQDKIDKLTEIQANSIIREPISTKLFQTDKKPDYYIVPVYFSDCGNSADKFESVISILEYYKEFPEKHIFFDMNDLTIIPENISKSIIFKVSSNKNNTHGMYYPINWVWWNWLSLEKPKSILESLYDVSFQGTLSTYNIREKIPDVFSNSSLKCYLKTNNIYFYDNDKKTKSNLMFDYYDSIINSKFVLCPRGFGLSSHRLYEVLAAGRIPIIISDDLILPLDKYLNWNKFSIKIPECDLYQLDKYIKDFKLKNDLKLASELALSVWKKYFSVMGLKNFLDCSLLRFNF